MSIFTCPSCRGGKLSPSLTCLACGKQYQMLDGIARLVDQENYSQSFGYQWNIHSKTQLDSYSGLPISRDRIYAATSWSGEKLIGQKILEAGSGAGRFTEILVETGADVFSFDFSRAVDANARTNGHAKNLVLFQGDIFKIPFEKKTFDHVLCLGVIQHTPDPKTAFLSLAEFVKPGGGLYVDIYTLSWHHVFQWKYLLRPITKNIDRELLYKIISMLTPYLVPAAKLLKKIFGKAGARILPIVEYSQLGLDPKLNVEWAILDTFDMYSPAHDHPQSKNSLEQWFSEIGFTDVEVWYGDNGVVGRGKRPKK